MITNPSDVIIESVSRLTVPFIQLFGLYVIAHGHSSPGGGFQGGVIIAAAIILLVLAFSWHEAYQRFSERTLTVLACVGVLIYVGTGVACVLAGGHFLEYGALSHWFGGDEAASRYQGQAVVEWGVGIAVMAIMVSLFLDLVTGGRHEEAFEDREAGQSELVDP
jgi:multicomponent Na+:H+ antiporter subunit B